MVKGDIAKINAFHNGCSRKICGIFCPNKISNVELHKKCCPENKMPTIDVLRMPKESIPKVAVRWTPSRRRKPGQPKTTCRKTVMVEQDMGLSWGEAHATLPQQRTGPCG